MKRVRVSKFKGEISSNDTLIIGERAVLQADIRAGRLVVNGEVTGNLSATATYIISSNAPPASDTLTLGVNDGGNTGSGGAQSGSARHAHRGGPAHLERRDSDARIQWVGVWPSLSHAGAESG